VPVCRGGNGPGGAGSLVIVFAIIRLLCSLALGLAADLDSFFQKGFVIRTLARSVLTVYALSGHFGQIRKYSNTALKKLRQRCRGDSERPA